MIEHGPECLGRYCTHYDLQRTDRKAHTRPEQRYSTQAVVGLTALQAEQPVLVDIYQQGH